MLRLRQICIATPSLEPATLLANICGVSICYRDPQVNKFGLENSLLAFGPTFIEFVAPIAPDTAATRFLAKHPAGGGYMTILDCDELAAMRTHVETLGIRIAHESDTASMQADNPERDSVSHNYSGFANIQLHPRDTGATMLEFNWTKGGEDIYGAYAPAGPHWQQFARATPQHRLSAAELCSPGFENLARRWSTVLQRSTQRDNEHIDIVLDTGRIRFTRGDREEFAVVHIQVPDAERVLANAKAQRCQVDANRFHLAGMQFVLSTG